MIRQPVSSTSSSRVVLHVTSPLMPNDFMWNNTSLQSLEKSLPDSDSIATMCLNQCTSLSPTRLQRNVRRLHSMMIAASKVASNTTPPLTTTNMEASSNSSSVGDAKGGEGTRDGGRRVGDGRRCEEGMAGGGCKGDD